MNKLQERIIELYPQNCSERVHLIKATRYFDFDNCDVCEAARDCLDNYLEINEIINIYSFFVTKDIIEEVKEYIDEDDEEEFGFACVVQLIENIANEL